jgi:hypothetical protein
MKQPLIDVVTQFVEDYRTRYQDDNVNWFWFSYADIPPDLRRYYVRRRSWRFSLQAPTPEELAKELTSYLGKYVMKGVISLPGKMEGGN